MNKCDSQQQIEGAGDDKSEMRLGRLEFAAMNNPVRRWLQKHIEFMIFKNGFPLSRE
jgi:hypothetical protein